MKRVLRLLIRGYAYLVSPLFGRSCRYTPTCSAYADTAIETHGACKGILLTIARICKCHPWSKCSYHDPVPERFAWTDFLGYKRTDKNQSSKLPQQNIKE